MLQTGYIPQRQCVGCKSKKAKSELFRFVASEQGELVPDRKKALPGRGAYLCGDPACLEKAIKKGSFSRTLRKKVRIDDPRDLAAWVARCVGSGVGA